MPVPHTAAMKFSFRYGDRTSLYEPDAGSEDLQPQILIGTRDLDGDEFQIDLDETRPKVIKEYRQFVDTRKELYANLFSKELAILVSVHVNGDPNARDEAEALFRMRVALMQIPNPPDFGQYFVGLAEKLVGAEDVAHRAKISFGIGRHRSQYVIDKKTGRIDNNTFTGVRPEAGEFVIDMDTTDHAKISEYRRFVSEHTTLYFYLFNREMFAYATTRGEGAREAKNYAKMLYELNQKFEETAPPMDFETFFAAFSKSAGQAEDLVDQGSTRLSFDFGEYRSQYVADAGSDVHYEHNLIVGGPPMAGETIIDINETRPEKLEEYARFADAHTKLYMNLFATEMVIQVRAYMEGDEEAKELARALYNKTCDFSASEKSRFEEYFASGIKNIKKEASLSPKEKGQ